ncbi:hypothetical protein FHS43_000971 [Streptosporangium becharense]|uniref:Protein-glutamine gamma-glutamyltransferase-like C-terminal domain-containing protein n=1 Tax=Streptosporangium becharense TaxID=1816182 RepID=A0A7W9IEL0_9ACTN|nr:DUF4129 domain-containing protein [Streptosporangium becharense]MBB2909725.1 hypothetical protein [Streptosporangium becharense]MBB5819319.1 hypothetical protein [Streptosporangium becharense]
MSSVVPPLAPPVDVGREEAQRQAAQELLKAEYADESLLDRILRGVDQFLGDLLDLESVDVGGGVAVRIALAVIVVALLAALVVIARRTVRSGAARREGVFTGRRRSAAEHREAAERLAAEGRWSDAVRERLRAIAADLEERVIVNAVPGRTADELAAEAGRALPGFAAGLTAAARVFDDVTYGEVPGTAEDYGLLRDLDLRLRDARPVLVPAAAETPPGTTPWATAGRASAQETTAGGTTGPETTAGGTTGPGTTAGGTTGPGTTARETSVREAAP